MGYRKRFTTLAEHRQALEGLDWREVLSFDTDQMDRPTLVSTTHEVAEQLNQLKFDARLIDEATFSTVRDHLAKAREVLAVLDRSRGLPRAEREAVLHRLHAEVAAANTGTVSGPGELKWTPATGIRVTRTLLSYLASAVGGELRNSALRFRGRYDIAALARDP